MDQKPPKPWWQSKQLWVGMMLILLGALELMPPHPWVTMGIGFLMIALRLATGREVYLWKKSRQGNN